MAPVKAVATATETAPPTSAPLKKTKIQLTVVTGMEGDAGMNGDANVSHSHQHYFHSGKLSDLGRKVPSWSWAIQVSVISETREFSNKQGSRVLKARKAIRASCSVRIKCLCSVFALQK